MGLSRLREYYADRNSVSVVDDGARKLSEGLAKIAIHTGRVKRQSERSVGSCSFRALFITDPNRASKEAGNLSYAGRYTALSDQQLVRQVSSRKLTTSDKILELFSTHPNIVKR